MEDDIRKYRIVGVPQPLGHSANALFEVIGYIHSNGTYVPLTSRTKNISTKRDGRRLSKVQGR